MEKEDPTQAQDATHSFREMLLEISIDERTAMLCERLREDIAAVLETDVEEVSPDVSLSRLNPEWSDHRELGLVLFFPLRDAPAL